MECSGKVDHRVRPSRIPELVGDLMKNDGLARLLARQELALIGEEAVPLLVALLDDDRWRVRWEAAKTLAEIRSPQSGEALVRTLADEKSSVRWVAAEAVLALGTKALSDLLRELIRKDHSVRFREGALHVLRGFAEDPVRSVVAPVIRALEAPDAAGAPFLEAYRSLGKLRELCPDA